MTERVNLIVGFDQREAIAYHVFCQSVIERASLPVQFLPLNPRSIAGYTERTHADVAGLLAYLDAAAVVENGLSPAEVGVVTVAPAEVGLFTELPGRTEASRVAQVRARAAGILLQRQFREGAEVRAGQALFQIDAAPYRAACAV